MMVDKNPLDNVPGPGHTPMSHSVGNVQKFTAGGKRSYDFPVVEKKITRSEDGSLGVKLRTLKKKHHAQITVHSCEPLGPAEKAGLRRGHIIVEVNGVCVIGFNHESVVALLRPKRSSGNISEHDAVRMKVCNPDDFDAVETEKIRKSAVSVGSKSVLTPSPRHNSDANSLLSRRLQYTPKYSEHDSVEERLSSTQEQITNLLVIFDMLRKNDGLTQRGEAMLVDAGVIQLLNGIVSSVDSNSGGAVVINRISNESTHTDGDAPSEAPSATVNSSPSKPSRIRHANSELQDKSRVSEGAAQTHLKKTSRSPTRLASQKHLVRNTREGGTAIITNAHSSHDRDNTAITAANERRRISGPQYMQKFEPKKSKRVPTSISSKTAWPIDGRRAKMPKESKKNSQQNASVIGLQVVQLHDVVPMSPSSVTHDGESIADSGRAEGNSQADSSSSRTYKDFVRNTHDAPDEWKKQSSPRQTQTNVMDGAVFTDPIYKMKSIGASGTVESHRTLL